MTNQMIVVTVKDGSKELIKVDEIKRLFPSGVEGMGTFIVLEQSRKGNYGLDVLETIEDIAKQLVDCLSVHTKMRLFQ